VPPRILPVNVSPGAAPSPGGSRAGVTPVLYTTVLVIDDDPAVRAVVGAMAERHGYSVQLAAGGDEGIRLYRRHRGGIAAVVLDVQMPGKDGPATLTELRALNPALPCVFVTGFSPHYTHGELADRGAVVLSKPLTSDELGQALRAATGGAGKVVVTDPDGTAETLPETPPLLPR
jgi:CheY-like chemotaxis protein